MSFDTAPWGMEAVTQVTFSSQADETGPIIGIKVPKSSRCTASARGKGVNSASRPYFFAVTVTSMWAAAFASFVTPTVVREGRGSGKNVT